METHRKKSFDFGEREGQFAVSPIIKETGNMWGINLPNKVLLNTNLQAAFSQTTLSVNKLKINAYECAAGAAFSMPFSSF